MKRNEVRTARGNGNGHDQDAAEVPEKDDVRERDENDFFDQRGLQRVDGMVDQRAAVVERNDVHAFRQARLHRLDLCFDRVDDFAAHWRRSE